MPELPEVETVRRDLSKYLVGASFQEVKIIDFKNVAPKATFLAKFLVGKEIAKVARRGKLLIIDLKDSDSHLLFHLKMTGQLIFLNQQEKIGGGHSLSDNSFVEAVGGKLPNKYTRAYFIFNNNSRLFFNDLRKFGYIKLVDTKELDVIISNNYGPEPLEKEFNLNYLTIILKNRKRPVKGIILDQKLIAGLGNIYADEALFMAGILPWREAGSLKKSEIENLLLAIKEVIKKAIKARGTTFRNFVDGQGKKGNFSKLLQVYGRQNQACLKCASILLKKKVAGRGTHYCIHCQK